MLPLFAYLALTVSPYAPIMATKKAPSAIDLRYCRPSAAPAQPRRTLLAAATLQASGIIDLKEAAFGVLDRSAPAVARYARGPIVVLPLFAPTVERDTAYGAALSLRLP